MTAAIVCATIFFLFRLPEKFVDKKSNGQCQCQESEYFLNDIHQLKIWNAPKAMT